VAIKEAYFIERVPNSVAQEIVVHHHYLHRKAPCSMAFGLFEKSTGQIVGVVIYGVPAGSPLRKGICGPEEATNVYELTRLWIHDSVPKNGESYLIGNSLPKLDKQIVVSFADTSEDHVGIVYQATNWLYTGLSAKRTDWVVEGEDKHGHTWADKYTANEMREIFGDRFRLVQRSRKHRYIYFNAKGKARKALLAKLRYPLEPYPKPTVGVGAKIGAGRPKTN
jgi:hypothetical protein